MNCPYGLLLPKVRKKTVSFILAGILVLLQASSLSGQTLLVAAASSMRDALEEVQACYPVLLTIVLCRAGGEHEWTEVLEAGAFDLLTAPHRECAVLSVLEHAVASRDARAIGIVT